MKNIKVDWLTLTKKLSLSEFEGNRTSAKLIQIMLREVAAIGFDTTEWEVSRGDGFYDAHVRLLRGDVRVSGSMSLDRQGIRCVASGNGLVGDSFAVRVLWSAVESNWKPTRIDIALDVWNEGVSVEDWYEAWMNVHADNLQKSIKFLKSPRGDSFYVGSRHSETMLRIYDKAKEQGLANDWIRLEAECKGSRAITITPKILADLQSTAMLHVMLLSLPKYAPAQEIEEFAHGEIIRWDYEVKSKDSTLKWLRDVVAPSLAKLYHEDVEEYEALMSLVSGLSLRLEQGQKQMSFTDLQ